MLKKLVILLSVVSIFIISCKKESVKLPEMSFMVQIDGFGILEEQVVPQFRVSKEFREARNVDSLTVIKYMNKYFLEDIYFVAEARALGMEEDPEYQRELHERKVVKLTHIDGPLYQKIIPESFGMSNSELRELYEKVKTSLLVSHIKVATEELADSLHQLLLNGADFGDLAERYSNELNSASYSGLIPRYFTFGTYARSFEEAAFDLEPGEFSEPVQTNTGFHIILLKERKKNELDPFEKVEHLLTDRLQSIKKTEFIQDYINDLFKKYPVKINKNTVKKLFLILKDKAPKEMITFNASQESLGNDEIAHFENTSIKVADIVYKYNKLSTIKRIPVRSEGELNVLINSLLVQELMFLDALDYELDNDDLYLKNIRKIEYGLLIGYAREKLIKKNIKVSDEEVKEFYSLNKDKWKNDTFDKVEKYVRNRVKDIKTQEYRKDLLDSIKKKFTPEYNVEAIGRVAADFNKIKEAENKHIAN